MAFLCSTKLFIDSVVLSYVKNKPSVLFLTFQYPNKLNWFCNMVMTVHVFDWNYLICASSYLLSILCVRDLLWKKKSRSNVSSNTQIRVQIMDISNEKYGLKPKKWSQLFWRSYHSSSGSCKIALLLAEI